MEPQHRPFKKTKKQELMWLGQCLRKKRLNEKTANKVIDQRAKEGLKLYKYLCPHCHGWHLTRKKQSEIKIGD